jgi:hypothetical protein
VRALWKKNLLCVLTPCGAATVGGTSKALGSGYSTDSPVPGYFDLLTAGGVVRSIRAQAKIFIAGGEAARIMTAIHASPFYPEACVVPTNISFGPQSRAGFIWMVDQDAPEKRERGATSPEAAHRGEEF